MFDKCENPTKAIFFLVEVVMNLTPNGAIVEEILEHCVSPITDIFTEEEGLQTVC